MAGVLVGTIAPVTDVGLARRGPLDDGASFLPEDRADERPDAAQISWGVSDVCEWIETCRAKLGTKTDAYLQLVMSQDIDGEVLNDVGHQEMTQ